MSDGEASRQLQPKGQATTITLGNNALLDISSLTEAQRQSLLNDHARGVVDINKRALELGVDKPVAQPGRCSPDGDVLAERSRDGTRAPLTH